MLDMEGMIPGAVANGLKEKDFNLEAAIYMYDRLNELGIPAILTRDKDITLTRNERINNALNAFGKNSNVILISNHINAGGGEGAEVVYALRNDATLAEDILKNIGEAGQKTRKVYQRRLPENPSQDYYYIIRQTNPLQSLLIEYGFIDNKADAQKLQNHLLDYVEGAVKAIANYANVPYKAPNDNNANTDEYVVKKGDTLYSVAQKFNTSVEELKKLNNLTSNILSIGQILLIKGLNNPSNDNIYIVQSGDTLYSIANKFGLTVDELKDLNNLTSNTLSIGQVLNISNNIPEIPEENEHIYKVEKGDTLYSIAQKFNTTVSELKKLNNLTLDTLYIGQPLIIPNKEEDKNEDYLIYIVKNGDTLYSIAQTYNISVDDIKRLNGLITDTLTIGQEIRIPTPYQSDTYVVYKVQRGDSLYSIAKKYNVSVDELKELNNLTSNLISIGQELSIPSNYFF